MLESIGRNIPLPMLGAKPPPLALGPHVPPLPSSTSSLTLMPKLLASMSVAHFPSLSTLPWATLDVSRTNRVRRREVAFLFCRRPKHEKGCAQLLVHFLVCLSIRSIRHILKSNFFFQPPEMIQQEPTLSAKTELKSVRPSKSNSSLQHRFNVGGDLLSLSTQSFALLRRDF
ncbi:hypothetical protein K402DRAFT_49631 [Aulographum hederae CBS 113979]|uniref:Uncharacterized protein n=1 Tax=Aulographum hederae CBS 113979 TaxID=1176131 RepID=A0A6G1H2L4_9PEZI|nr:hypothetical protein K402DRAFT_49631 [Aulographum hederae CBS 113979]